MTASSAQRWLRLRLGPEVRVIARDGSIRIVHEMGGKQTTIGQGVNVDAAVRSVLAAASDAVAAPRVLAIRVKARSPWEAFALALKTFWAGVLMMFARRRG